MLSLVLAIRNNVTMIILAEDFAWADLRMESLGQMVVLCLTV
jgi:hypothetical protein